MKTWVKVAAVMGGIVLVGVLALGYMGFLPFVSDLMGTNKATDLGVKYTAADAATATDKFGTLMNSPDGATVTLTDSELTAFINDKTAKSDIPLENTQIRVNPDGTIEMSGNINMTRLQALANSADVDASAKSLIGTVTSLVKTDPSFSGKAQFSVVDGKLVASMEDVKIGNFGLSSDQAAAMDGMIESTLEDIMRNSGLSFSELQASAGSLTIGTAKAP
ncbi:MAG: hypothetical protein WC941_02785 [Candidatus Bathyarchaeia archaeon]